MFTHGEERRALRQRVVDDDVAAPPVCKFSMSVGTCELSVSVGISEIDPRTPGSIEVLEQADRSMYAEKLGRRAEALELRGRRSA